MSVVNELPKYIDDKTIQWTSPSGTKTFTIGDCIQLNLKEGKQVGTIRGFYDDDFSYRELHGRNAHPIQNGALLVRPKEIAIDFKGSPYFDRLSLLKKDNRDTIISKCELEVTAKSGKTYVIPNVESNMKSGLFGSKTPPWMPKWLQGGRKTRRKTHQKYRARLRKSKSVKRLHRRM